MSSISGIDSNSLLTALVNSLNNSSNSSSSQDTEAENTDISQTMTTSDSTATSTKSLLDQMKSSFLQNQYSFMTSLLYPDNSTSSDSSDSLTSILENVEADKTNNVIANNPQLAQLFNALNLSSSSSGSSDLTTSLLQSLDSKGLSESNSASIKTAMENLLKSYGSDINSSTQEILNKYLSLSYDKPPQIKTIV